MSDNFQNEPTKGEQFIALFLKREGIKFKTEVKINNLGGDSKAYRVADFYLPWYKVYVEFLGQWNEQENRIRYREKKNVYYDNKIPCVYIYPDNLGIMEFAFDFELKRVLKFHHMNQELFLYNFRNFWRERAESLFILIISLLWVLMFATSTIDGEYDTEMIVGGSIVLTYQLVLIVRSTMKHFKKS